jgi:Cof subfamily protein (haloacid dehalogenase superfamily)
MKRIKLIVCDLDGTLLNEKKLISEANFAAIREARKQGIAFTICTGRITGMAAYYIQDLAPGIPYVAANGALICDPVAHTPLRAYPIPTPGLHKALAFCEAHCSDYSALTLDGCFFTKESVRIENFLLYNRIASRNGRPEIKLKFFDRGHRCLNGMDVYKILIDETDAEKYIRVKEMAESDSSLSCSSSGAHLIEIGHVQASKGNGVKTLAQLLNLNKHEICVMGDYLNDISMFEESGLAIAMQNACEAVRQKADYITKTNSEDGVAWAIRRLILKKDI